MCMMADGQKESNMNAKRIKQLIDEALVYACEVPVKGPAAVNMGKTIELLSVAVRELNDGAKTEENRNAASGDEVR